MPNPRHALPVTFLTALIGGVVFKLLHIPVPWLLGPMLAVLAGSSVRKNLFRWPGPIRNAGMIVVGYTIGLSMTSAALHEMVRQLPTMLLMTVLLLLFCAFMAFIVTRLSGNPYLTMLMGSIPGGLTQVITLAEETEGVNLTVVTVMQVVRLMMIVICVPVLVFSPLLGLPQHGGSAPEISHPGVTLGSGDIARLALFAGVCVVCAIVGNRIRFPTAYLLGPAIGTAVLQAVGFQGPPLPSIAINAAQFMIGTYVGLLLKPGELPRKLRLLTLALMSGLLLVLGALGLSLLLTRLEPVSMSTALLSLAPGGMDQMGVMAHEVNADLSMVAGYQLFRTFFIFFAVPPLFKLAIRLIRRK
ncbi:AbrB family transcriptional regulator [Cohnella candidum]|uniref:AbrB family transcriptional regulator n=1 Tax=Cohnella candidum TaxID=2674991 RepID=A0A3G3JTE0_9BACL|nr:AbrB family transcriptional regulator [Cohnella candidum]AYQ71488.1 AbrB family transcriptional regulator [Cohnella candidum]